MKTFGDLLICPCGGELVASQSDTAVQCLLCTQSYDYLEGILRALPSGGLVNEEARIVEEKTRDKQAKYYDFYLSLNLPTRLETMKMRPKLRGIKSIAALDVGCGTGRYTLPIAEISKRVVGIDRSLVSLQECRRKIVQQGFDDRMLLIQADANSMPLRPGAFDLAVVAQVLQHIPDKAARSEAVDRIAAALGPKGRFLVTLYEWSGPKPYRPIKEGQHRGGISFFRFTEADARELLEPRFEVQSIASCFGELLVADTIKR